MNTEKIQQKTKTPEPSNRNEITGLREELEIKGKKNQTLLKQSLNQKENNTYDKSSQKKLEMKRKKKKNLKIKRNEEIN